MKVKDFIEILSQAPQDAEIFIENFYSNLNPIGSLWLCENLSRLVVSQYVHDSSDSEPNLFSVLDYEEVEL